MLLAVCDSSDVTSAAYPLPRPLVALCLMLCLLRSVHLLHAVLQTYTAVEVASRYFRAGADKISLGSDAVYAAEVRSVTETVTLTV